MNLTNLPDLQRLHLLRQLSRAGRTGSREKKRQAMLRTWANLDPSKRPGRKKGSPIPLRKQIPQKALTAYEQAMQR